MLEGLNLAEQVMSFVYDLNQELQTSQLFFYCTEMDLRTYERMLDFLWSEDALEKYPICYYIAELNSRPFAQTTERLTTSPWRRSSITTFLAPFKQQSAKN